MVNKDNLAHQFYKHLKFISCLRCGNKTKGEYLIYRGYNKYFRQGYTDKLCTNCLAMLERDYDDE